MGYKGERTQVLEENAFVNIKQSMEKKVIIFEKCDNIHCRKNEAFH